jgi:hypothetical protein
MRGRCVQYALGLLLRLPFTSDLGQDSMDIFSILVCVAGEHWRKQGSEWCTLAGCPDDVL